jgi:hypothetical protein
MISEGWVAAGPAVAAGAEGGDAMPAAAVLIASPSASAGPARAAAPMAITSAGPLPNRRGRAPDGSGLFIIRGRL